MVPSIEGSAVRVYSFILTFMRGVLEVRLWFYFLAFSALVVQRYIFRPFGNFCFDLRLTIRFH